MFTQVRISRYFFCHLYFPLFCSKWVKQIRGLKIAQRVIAQIFFELR